MALLFTNSVHAQAIKEHKVVIQLNTADTASWSSTIGNIRNLQKFGLIILVSKWLHMVKDWI